MNKTFVFIVSFVVSAIVLPTVSQFSAFSDELTKASLTKGNSFGDRVSVKINNVDAFPEDTKFEIYVNGSSVGSHSAAALKKQKGVFVVNNDGQSYFSPETNYKIAVRAKSGESRSRASAVRMSTSCNSFFTVKKGAKLYSRVGANAVYSKRNPDKAVFMGEVVGNDGQSISGKSVSSGKPTYIKLKVPKKCGKNKYNEQLYKYETYYVKNSSSNLSRKTINSARKDVVDHAVSMSRKASQTYKISGEIVEKNRTISDCSGVNKLSYLKIGYYMVHFADRQAVDYGKTVYDNTKSVGEKNGTTIYRLKNQNSCLDYSKLQKGDMLFFICSTNTDNGYVEGGIGHTGMYIGNRKMVHFTSAYGLTNHPCRIENLDAYQKHLKVAKAVRVIY